MGFWCQSAAIVSARIAVIMNVESADIAAIPIAMENAENANIVDLNFVKANAYIFVSIVVGVIAWGHAGNIVFMNPSIIKNKRNTFVWIAEENIASENVLKINVSGKM